MEAFKICIAGLCAEVRPMFLSTREYCKKYLSNEAAEVSVTVTPEDLLYEQKMADIEADEEGLKRRKFTDPFLERAAIQRKIANELLKRDALMVHGSTVALDGEAYMFTAACGTGKSTHTRLWREVFGERAVMVNDDKPFLQITPSGVFAWGSPWSGKHGLDTNVCFPLKGICFLRRGKENRISPMNRYEGLIQLMRQAFVPEDPEGGETASMLLDALSEMVPLWQMECTKDPEAALVAYQAMYDSCASEVCCVLSG